MEVITEQNRVVLEGPGLRWEKDDVDADTMTAIIRLLAGSKRQSRATAKRKEKAA